MKQSISQVMIFHWGQDGKQTPSGKSSVDRHSEVTADIQSEKYSRNFQQESSSPVPYLTPLCQYYFNLHDVLCSKLYSESKPDVTQNCCLWENSGNDLLPKHHFYMTFHKQPNAWLGNQDLSISIILENFSRDQFEVNIILTFQH